MKEISTQIIINASAEKVWGILMNFMDYPNWNPFILSVENDVAVNSKIKVVLSAPGKKPMVFIPKVLVLSENKEFRWLGHLLFPGLFDGEHIFELNDNNDGTTTFIQREMFKGILVPVFKKMLDNNTREGFILMNEKLKEICEK